MTVSRKQQILLSVAILAITSSFWFTDLTGITIKDFIRGFLEGFGAVMMIAGLTFKRWPKNRRKLQQAGQAE